MAPGNIALCLVLLSFCLLPDGTSSDIISCDVYEGAEVCYTISDVVMTWQKAFDYCRSLPPDGGVLAAVYNVDIQNRLAKVLENVTSPLWIAGKTEDPKLLEGNIVSQWRWVYDCDRCDTIPKLQKHALEAQGCYKDWSAYPDLNYKVHDSGSNVTACKDACSGYTYAGLQQNQMCSCDYEYGNYGTMDGCISECGGNCGGYGRNFIYRLGGQFSAWAYEQPDNDRRTDGTQFCVASNLADSLSPPHYRYSDEDCNEAFRYICSFAQPCNTGEVGGNYYNTTFGSCVYVSNETDSWHRARTACWDMGGDLVSFANLSQHNEVLTEAARLLGPVKVYIGLYREAMVWRRVYREVEMNYYNFSDGQPNMALGTCLVMDPGDSFMWSISDCNNNLTAVCYQGPDMDPAPTTAATATTITTVTTATTSSMTTKSSTTGLPDVTLVPPTNPGESTPGTVDKTTIILLSVLIPAAVLLIIFIILLLVQFCKKREGSVDPSTDKQKSKEKVDARLQATKPQTSQLGEIDEGYFDMGSTVNLIYNSEKHDVPKKKHASKKENTDLPELVIPGTIRRNSNELILIPDFTSPEPDPSGGKYEYEGSFRGHAYLTARHREETVPAASYASLNDVKEEPVTPQYTVETRNALSTDVINTQSPDILYAEDGSVMKTISDISVASLNDSLGLSSKASGEPLLDNGAYDLDLSSADGGGDQEGREDDEPEKPVNEERPKEPAAPPRRRSPHDRQMKTRPRDGQIHVKPSEGGIDNAMEGRRMASGRHDMPPVV